MSNTIKSHGIMDDSQFHNVVIQLTDHLFEQGHTINRPLIIDAAEFVRMYAESWYMQGKNSAVQSDNQLHKEG